MKFNIGPISYSLPQAWKDSQRRCCSRARLKPLPRLELSGEIGTTQGWLCLPSPPHLSPSRVSWWLSVVEAGGRGVQERRRGGCSPYSSRESRGKQGKGFEGKQANDQATPNMNCFFTFSVEKNGRENGLVWKV